MKVTLLTAEIAEKVLAEKTKRNQKPQGYYDQTAKDLNEVMPGNTVVVKPKGLLSGQGWKKEIVLVTELRIPFIYDVNVPRW